jgi:hypothetical protein
MAGITTKFGKIHFGNIKYVSTAPQNYFLRLITNGDINKDTVTDDDIQMGSGLTEITGTGYAAIELLRGSWVKSEPTEGGKTRIVYTYPQQIFTVGAGGWSNVKGYALSLTASGNDVIAAESFPTGQQGSKIAGQQLKISPRMYERREDE